MSAASSDNAVDAVVFAGGGNRCLWQAGFWSVASPALGLAPSRVAAVSAGATVAALVLSGRHERAITYFKEITARNSRNAYPFNILRKKPVFPHAAMYRGAILHALDAAALSQLHAGPDLRVLVARPPEWLHPRAAVLLGFAAYEGEKRVSGGVHPRAGRKLGFRPEVISVRECATPEDLADVLLASSCTPPFTPVQRRGGRPALDGGLVDNVPVDVVDEPGARTLVLLTRSYTPRAIPSFPGRLYVQPTEPIAVGKWDYTNPRAIQDTYDAGQRDGEKFVRQSRQRGGIFSST